MTSISNRLFSQSGLNGLTDEPVNDSSELVFSNTVALVLLFDMFSQKSNNEDFIIFKQYYVYNYTPLYLKVVHHWLVC